MSPLLPSPWKTTSSELVVVLVAVLVAAGLKLVGVNVELGLRFIPDGALGGVDDPGVHGPSFLRLTTGTE